MIPTTVESRYLHMIPGYHKLDKQARLADVNDTHIATNTWYARLECLARMITKCVPTDYYARSILID